MSFNSRTSPLGEEGFIEKSKPRPMKWFPAGARSVASAGPLAAVIRETVDSRLASRTAYSRGIFL